MPSSGQIWVTGTSTLIAFISYSPQLTGLITSAPRWQLVLFNALVALLWYNYARTVRTDPGSVPAGWTPGEELPEMRFCKKCEVLKPPRAHHCRYCKRCILRYDHHCPWVNNCVGHRNYPFFLRFLLYVDLACCMHLYLLTVQAFDETRLMREPTPIELVFLVANYVCCIPVTAAVGLFSLYHFWNLLENSTTIEGAEIAKVRKMVKRGKIQKTPFPFNVGIVSNFTSVLGHTPGEWLFGSRIEGDGLSFPSVEGSEPLRWPPRDPYENLRESWAREAEMDMHRSRYPPYHPKYQALDAQDNADEDDEVPLEELRRRNVRIRRGSEGFEVRPTGLSPSSSEEESQEELQGPDEDWDTLFEKRKTLYDSGSDDD